MFSFAGILFPCLVSSFQAPIFAEFASPILKSQEWHQKLRDVVPQIETIKQIGGTAGISIGVLHHGDVVMEHNFGFADVERQLVANSSTTYPIGSLTKAFVSATAAQLVHDGLLQWDAPITTIYQSFSFSPMQR
jgi:CubicO group peptidase (beta-lactamase class C family)